jgi:two-component system chemotaxis response regulator CheB
MAIQVYVGDDSAVVRQTLMHLLQGDPEIVLMRRSRWAQSTR